MLAISALLAASALAQDAGRPQANAAPTHAVIPFKSGLVLSTFAPAGASGDALRSAATRAARFSLHFDRHLTLADQQQVRAAGITLLSYLGNDAYFATARNGIDAAALNAMQIQLAVHDLDPAWKLHRDFASGNIPAWAIVPPQTQEDDNAEDRLAEPMVAACVMLHPDVAVADSGAEIAAARQARLITQTFTNNGMVIELPLSELPRLAQDDRVLWIEPPLPPLEELNDSNRARVGADTLAAAPYGLTGAGVKVMVYDGGQVRGTHQDLAGRVELPDAATVSNHSTHVAGTVAGTGAAQGGTFRGMAPGAGIVSFAFEFAGGNGFLYTDPGDMEADYTQAVNSLGADISNNSIGNNTAPNGFDCAREGDYGFTDTIIDDIVRGDLGAPFRVVWSNGNERQGSARCGSTYRTTGPPACAKNHITVGALNSNDDSMTDFSSWGPADDGRMKPDVSGPGCQAGGDGGVRSCGSSSDVAYSTLCGTSMSGPTVAGIGALILQDYRARYPGQPDFLNSTLKVLLAHSAADLGNVGPDNQFGYGSVRGVAAVDLLRTGNFLERSVAAGGTFQFFVRVAAGESLKVTLAWDDLPGTPLVNPALVNNLDLRVTDTLGTTYFPWTLSLANPGAPAVQTQANAVDNIEQVFIANPAPGTYRVEVLGTNIPGGTQTFSVVASPTLVNCSNQGLLLLDRGTYSCGANVTASVVDCGLNTDDNTIESIQLTLTSTTEPAGETFVLTETGPGSAQFEGTLPLAATNAPGTLHVADADTISLTYVDADDGLGGTNVPVTRSATLDCVPSQISGLQITNITAHTARVTFNTDEPALVSVRYGTSCSSLTDVEAGPGAAATAHTIDLDGLIDESDYYIVLEAVDRAANVTVADNAGACFTFTTLVEPRLTLPFIDSFDSTTFDPARWTLADGATIDNLGLNPPSAPLAARFNGAPDGSDELRSFLIDLSNVPAAWLIYHWQIRGGGESPDANDDLIVEYIDAAGNWQTLQRHLGSGPDMTTFTRQEMLLPAAALHRNFRLRFRNTATVGAFDDWFVDDVSISRADRPLARNISAATVGAAPVNITLDAIDPTNDPLTYTIRSLPATGTLTDLGTGGGVISSVPYTLLGGGRQVRYAPSGGSDSFTYTASDGQMDSNAATVSVFVEVPLPLPFVDNFTAATFDPQKWTVVTGATIDNLGLNPPSAPLAARFNGDPSGADEIRSAVLLMPAARAARLTYSFQIRGGGESPDAGDDLFVEYLGAQGTWQLLRQHLGSGPDMTTFQQDTITLPAAAIHPNVRVRFRNRATTGAFDDWFVDNVRITAVAGDLNGDCVVNESDLGIMLQAFGTTVGGDLDRDGDTDEGDLGVLLSSWQATCP